MEYEDKDEPLSDEEFGTVALLLIVSAIAADPEAVRMVGEAFRRNLRAAKGVSEGFKQSLRAAMDNDEE